jgi:hypothetical protein
MNSLLKEEYLKIIFMKKVGVVVLLIGLSFTLITTLGLMISEHAAYPARYEIFQIKVRPHVWEPMVGTILVLIGTGMYKIAKKAEVKTRIEFRSHAKVM